MKQITERIILTLFVLVVLVWGGYHFTQYRKNNIVTEAVFEYSAEDILSGKGVVFRQEEILPQTQFGRISYLHEDGDRVALEEPVAEFFSSTVDDSSIIRMRELENEISMLEEAQNKNNNNFSSSGAINRDLRDKIGSLTWMSSTGRYSNLEDTQSEVVSLLNRRQIAISKEDNYEARIATLKTEYDSLQGRTGAQNVKFTATPSTGFFSRVVDGYETQYTVESMEHLTIADFEHLVEETLPMKKDNQVGKLVTNHKWYMGVVMPAHQTEHIRRNSTVSLIVDSIDYTIPAVISDILIENHNDTAVVIISSDIITKDTINLRLEDVQLSFGKQTGLRIDTEALRFAPDNEGNMVRGVYVLENHRIVFRQLDPIYENADYVLSRTYYSDSSNKEYVRLFDQIIIQGTDIYEGKIIQ